MMTALNSATLAGVEKIHSVLLFLQHLTPQLEPTTGGRALPARVEWLGAFAKVRGFSSQAGVATATAHVTLSLGSDSLSRWIPSAGGPAAKSFTAGGYAVVKGNYSIRATDGGTALLSVV